MRAREGDPWIVLAVTGIDERNGALRFDRKIPEGASARFMLGTAEHLIEGAGAAAQRGLDELRVAPQLTVAASCYGRRMILGERAEEELEMVREAVGDAAIAGFYSYGEISRRPVGFGAEVYNQAMTVTALAEV